MAKHQIQNLAEQIANKGRGEAPFKFGQSPYQANESAASGDVPTKRVLDIDTIQLRAYQLHQEKGGTALDNWLEAEQILGHDDQARVIPKYN